VASRHRGLKFSGPSKPRAARIQVGVTARSSALSFEQSASKLCCVNPVRTRAILTDGGPDPIKRARVDRVAVHEDGPAALPFKNRL
jgi:hypothetical protein